MATVGGRRIVDELKGKIFKTPLEPNRSGVEKHFIRHLYGRNQSKTRLEVLCLKY